MAAKTATSQVSFPSAARTPPCSGGRSVPLLYNQSFSKEATPKANPKNQAKKRLQRTKKKTCGKSAACDFFFCFCFFAWFFRVRFLLRKNGNDEEVVARTAATPLNNPRRWTLSLASLPSLLSTCPRTCNEGYQG